MPSSPFKSTLHTLKLAPVFLLLLQIPQATLDCIVTFLSVDQRTFIEKALIISVQLIVAQVVAALSFAAVRMIKNGKKPNFKQIVFEFRDRAWLLLAAGLIVGGICALGFMALIVPGFIFMALYVFVPYFLLEEKIPVFAALRRSMMLARDNFWMTFFLVMAFGIMQLLNSSLWDYFIGSQLHVTGDWTPMVLPFLAMKFITILVINAFSETYMPYFFYSRTQNENDSRKA